MFLKSIIEGFIILGHWQVWVAVVLYIMLKFVFGFFPLIFSGLLIGEGKSGRRTAIGMGGYMLGSIGGTIVQGILMVVLIAFLLPILLGGDSLASASVIIEILWPIIKVGMTAIVAVIVLSFIPIIGALIADTPGATDFLQGIIVFRLLFVDILLTKS